MPPAPLFTLCPGHRALGLPPEPTCSCTPQPCSWMLYHLQLGPGSPTSLPPCPPMARGPHSLSPLPHLTESSPRSVIWLPTPLPSRCCSHQGFQGLSAGRRPGHFPDLMGFDHTLLDAPSCLETHSFLVLQHPRLLFHLTLQCRPSSESQPWGFNPGPESKNRVWVTSVLPACCLAPCRSPIYIFLN